MWQFVIEMFDRIYGGVSPKNGTLGFLCPHFLLFMSSYTVEREKLWE